VNEAAKAKKENPQSAALHFVFHSMNDTAKKHNVKIIAAEEFLKRKCK